MAPRAIFLAVIIIAVIFAVFCGKANAQQKSEQPQKTPVSPVVPKQPEWLANWSQVNWEMEKIEKGIVTDTIFIHHTGLPSGATWQQLSAIQLKNIYEKRYASGDLDPYVKGLKPWSGHFRYDDKGKLVEVFYAYHWIVRQDGTVEELLPVNQVGWHAANWDENMRSLAIVLDGDFSKENPPNVMLEAVAKLMADTAKKFPLKRLKAHRDTKATECPGDWYFKRWGRARNTGREKLLYLSKLELSDK